MNLPALKLATVCIAVTSLLAGCDSVRTIHQNATLDVSVLNNRLKDAELIVTIREHYEVTPENQKLHNFNPKRGEQMNPWVKVVLSTGSRARVDYPLTILDPSRGNRSAPKIEPLRGKLFEVRVTAIGGPTETLQIIFNADESAVGDYFSVSVDSISEAFYGED